LLCDIALFGIITKKSAILIKQKVEKEQRTIGRREVTRNR